VTLAYLGADGRPDLYIKRDAPLGYGYYPAEQGIVVFVPELPRSGIYSVEVGAILKDGGSSTTSFLFYHAGI